MTQVECFPPWPRTVPPKAKSTAQLGQAVRARRTWTGLGEQWGRDRAVGDLQVARARRSPSCRSPCPCPDGNGGYLVWHNGTAR